jgi:hypothetical protein
MISKDLIPFDGVLHCHSHASDGSAHASRLPRALARRVPTASIFVLTDHWSVAGVPQFRDAFSEMEVGPCARRRIVAVGEEIGCSAQGVVHGGDILAIIPQVCDGERYVKEWKPYTKRPPIIDTVRRVIDMGGIVVVAHPGATLASGMRHRDIRLLAEGLCDEERQYCCIEVVNGLVRGFPFWPAVEVLNDKLADDIGFAKLYTGDVHLPYTAGHVQTRLWMSELSGEAFKEAIVARRTAPVVEQLPRYEVIKRSLVSVFYAYYATLVKNPGYWVS